MALFPPPPATRRCATTKAPGGSTAVDEFHFSIMRDATDLGQPIGGVGTSLASRGFVVGPDTPGIVPLSPETEGVENINFSNFSIGTDTNQLKQVNNSARLLARCLPAWCSWA
jgi:hypothetical protein